MILIRDYLMHELVVYERRYPLLREDDTHVSHETGAHG
jgi:hypothetical protein